MSTWKRLDVIVRLVIIFVNFNAKKFYFPLQTCSTTDTSCEAPNHIREESSVKVLALAGPSPDDLDY